jgi:calcineurin-like phosphoesterase family protein
MNECILDNWAQTVKPGDKVYHCGDVMFGDKQDFVTNWKKLPGSKNLIVGNHDDIIFMANCGVFKKLQFWCKFHEFNFLVSHIPLDKSGLFNWGSQQHLVNVHGHIHQNDSPPGPYVNVCVEKTNFTPIHMDEVIQLVNENMRNRNV